MKKCAWVLASFCLAASALAQPADTSAPLDIGAERARIQAERGRIDTQFEQAQSACYARFAVNDCLRALRAQRRSALDELRRQEVLLNDMQREQKTIERLRQLEDKAAGKP
jgi:colicin import membrane protein